LRRSRRKRRTGATTAVGGGLQFRIFHHPVRVGATLRRAAFAGAGGPAVSGGIKDGHVEVSEALHREAGGLAFGPDPNHTSYSSYASFADPDGTAWLLQEVTMRLPGKADESWPVWYAHFMAEQASNTASLRESVKVRRRFTGARMSTIHFNQTTKATPGQVVAAFTDFGPGRSQIFGKSADDYLEVYSESPGHADVREGSGGVWERLDYDWTDPNHITMKTIDSNTWGGKSGHTYTLTRQPDGGTDIDAVVVRDGKNFKGKMLGAVLGTVGKRVLAKEFGKTVKAIEARNGGASAKQTG
jgi:hypothetical protein